MKYCDDMVQDSFEAYKRFNDVCIITEFEGKVDVQNHALWVGAFSESVFFKLLNIDDKKM